VHKTAFSDHALQNSQSNTIQLLTNMWVPCESMSETTSRIVTRTIGNTRTLTNAISVSVQIVTDETSCTSRTRRRCVPHTRFTVGRTRYKHQPLNFISITYCH